jgi:DNA-binding MarR family transcriptional regulator
VDPPHASPEEHRDLEELYRSLGIIPSGSDEDDEGAPSPAELVAAARRFHRRLRRLLNEALESAGISYAQFEVLDALIADRNHHTGSLAQQLGITRQSAHDLVRKLDAAGFVERLPPDAGVRGVRVTDEGSAQRDRCIQALEPFRMALGRMTPEARRSFDHALIAAEAAIRPPPWWSF